MKQVTRSLNLSACVLRLLCLESVAVDSDALLFSGALGSVVGTSLRYKLEGHGFEGRCILFIFPVFIHIY